ncbi:MAG: helix-turn-helix transcriptional regulator, partial [Erysipelothrix sp.]|nr:helix-turn-helix transcriptional regulator [Erysipelothrix sp.]
KRITDQNNKEIIVQQICNYVDTNYGNNVSLSNVSRKFNYTAQYISTMFKDELNINYLEYVNQVRITKAKELLLTTRKPLIEISLDCGYNSEHTLIRNFKKYVGMTPNAYRKLV